MVALISLTIMLVPQTFANGCDGVTITKELACGSAPTSGLDLFTEYQWNIRITIRNNNPYPINDVRLKDKLGAEFKIDSVSEYTFTYSPYERDGAVEVDGSFGALNKDGVAFGTFFVYWTGNSIKAHFEWYIGTIPAGHGAQVYMRISTDTNPAGMQEFTSCGEYYLNSGATVQWDGGSAETEPIVVTTYV